ncbi:helix-turn-helix domain-containing protein [Sphingobium limneticum]|uniref:helix-turn-helix domain-containing protein n=1 Tax=Sphingobium limneticum TaxID=1007511 RepID=UPI003D072447
MAASNIATQADMMEKTGWSKAKMSQLYNAKQDFNSEVLTEAALALNARPYELLMPPEDAMAIRQLRQTALHIAADTHSTFIHGPDEARRVG